MVNASIDRAFDEIKDQIKGEVREATVGMAKIAINQLIKRSPIWGGYYIDSHRLSIDGSSVHRGKVSGDGTATGFAPKLSDAAANAKRRQRKAYLKRKTRQIKTFSKTVFSNDVKPHAKIVEWIGWAKTPAYGVYRKTARYLRSTDPVVFGLAATRQLIDDNITSGDFRKIPF